jgi:hypothetical protein
LTLTKTLLAALPLALLCLTEASQAAVVSGSFVPSATDTLESYGGDRARIRSLFEGTVPLTGRKIVSLDAGDWKDFRSDSPIQPVSGDYFAAIFGDKPFTMNFTGIGGILGFSGWATAADADPDQLTFLDMTGALLGTFTDPNGFGLGDGSMEFFSFTSQERIGSIIWQGYETAFDDIAILTVPPTAVPLPGAALLLIGGLATLAVLRRRTVI